MDHICNLIIKTGQSIQLFAYGAKDWHTRHPITPFYQNAQKEAVFAMNGNDLFNFTKEDVESMMEPTKIFIDKAAALVELP